LPGAGDPRQTNAPDTAVVSDSRRVLSDTDAFSDDCGARMQRRDLLAALAALGLVGRPGLAFSQKTARMPRLGILEGGKPSALEQWKKSRFAIKLRELGWTEGTSLAVERAYADGQFDRYPALAADLVRKSVDVICAFGPEASVAAARVTTTIPIVFWGVAFPIEQGLVESYARPGRNLTGPAWNAGASMYAKLFEIVRELSSSASRVAYFTTPTALRTVGGGQTDAFDREMTLAAKKLGMQTRSYPISKREDFEDAFNDMLVFRAQALIAGTSWLTFLEMARILDFVARNRLIGLYDTAQFVRPGGLISYGPDNQYLRERVAVYADRILRGQRPGDIPVEQPTKFETAINLKSALALGLTIPSSLLMRADTVVE
jgi:putative ABC transport system substrate-binding protein